MSISLRTTGVRSMHGRVSHAAFSSRLQLFFSKIFLSDRSGESEPRLLLRGVGIEEV